MLCNIGFIYDYNQHAMTDHRQVMLIGAAERNWTNSASKLDKPCLRVIAVTISQTTVGGHVQSACKLITHMCAFPTNTHSAWLNVVFIYN